MTKQNEDETIKGKPVLVTTEHRGVFFGYMSEDNAPADVALTHARLCLYWDTSMRGFLGLAESGPGAGCRVGPSVPALTLYKITSVTECTVAAVDRWEQAPWTP